MSTCLYDLTGGYQGSPVPMAIADLLGAFTGSSALVSKGLTTSAIDALQPGQIASNFLGLHNQQTNRAEVYLNYMFDDQFRYVSGDVDPVQVGGGYRPA